MLDCSMAAQFAEGPAKPVCIAEEHRVLAICQLGGRPHRITALRREDLAGAKCRVPERQITNRRANAGEGVDLILPIAPPWRQASVADRVNRNQSRDDLPPIDDSRV